MSVISELVGRLPSLRQKSVPIAQTRSESADTIVELITAVPGSPAMTSGTQGEALGGGWTVPTATGRIFCNVLVVKGLRTAGADMCNVGATASPSGVSSEGIVFGGVGHTW